MSAAVFDKIKIPNGIVYDQPTGLFIDNQFVPSIDGSKFDVFSPSDEEKITAVYEAKEADIDVAVAAAKRAFYKGPWARTTPAERARLLHKLADLIEKHAEVMAAIETYDCGKALSLARGDIFAVVGAFRYYAGWADKIHGKVVDVDSTSFNYTKMEPIGVVGQIVPWNFPSVMLANKIAPAIAAGNTVLLKSAEQTPLNALYIGTLVKEAGFPPGVINIVSGIGKIAGAAIASHNDIMKVAFTGSTLVGRAIMHAAADSNIKAVTLELGGKSPNIIFDDANIDKAVEWINFGIFFNCGQVCAAGSRVYVQEGVYDKVVAAFKKRAEQNIIGNPFDEQTFQGAQVSEAQFHRVMSYVESGKEEGATVVTGGERHGSKGYFIKPTIFSDVSTDMKIMREEIFGPVCAISKFTDMEDIIEKANDTVYGLAAAVHTTNLNTAIEAANRIRAGSVWVNTYHGMHWALPFGGFGQSGIGRENGKEAMKAYTEVKTVRISLEN
ncbi:putative aldehyde dehydrogenase [Myxozyma melibiosi]|uniref:Aldehyde dehydrogenase n=1 Tax=Myxozyma melibiosi TaxID=54550 RepID=A0ABR1F966_9ASCO